MPQPKAPPTAHGYKVSVIAVNKAPKTNGIYVLPKKAVTVPLVKAALPKIVTPIHPGSPQVKPTVPVRVVPRRVTRIKVRSFSHSILGSQGSSISLLKEALLSGLGKPMVRQALRVERWVPARVQIRARRDQREAPPQPSLLRTLQYQFDLVQMSEALRH